MKKIAILSWWTGYEREVALKSAQYFQENIEIPYDFYLLPEEFENFYQHKNEYICVIPVFHGEYWEDGKIFAFLELLWIPHFFSNSDVHAFCLDKWKTNIIIENLWVQIPKQYIYNWTIEIDTFPCIVKPNHGWSSFYTYKVQSQQELLEAVKEIQTHTTDQVLVQEFITGEEVSVPLVDWKVLPIMSLVKQQENAVFDYESKYETQNYMKEEFDIIWASEKEHLTHSCQKIYSTLWCKDIARIDFIINQNGAYFLEINTIPWMTQASILPQAWRKLGNTDTQLITYLLNKYIWK